MGKPGSRSGEQMSELDGFVVYKPDDYKPIYIAAGGKQIRISAEAYRRLGGPEWVNVFFDEVHKRVMIKAAEAGFENVVHCTCHSSGRNMSICYRNLTDKLIAMYGDVFHPNEHEWVYCPHCGAKLDWSGNE